MSVKRLAFVRDVVLVRDAVVYTSDMDWFILFPHLCSSSLVYQVALLLRNCLVFGCDTLTDVLWDSHLGVLRYGFLSSVNASRFWVVVSIVGDMRVSSIVSVFSGAGVLEREVFDKYGIVFSGNESLRRLFADYGGAVAGVHGSFDEVSGVWFDYRAKLVVSM